ncbi:MAG: hypothetical protein LCH85_00545 [Chloroflexi bacterium]|nr:hypothetical protein [Chloroflexota bacterium]
MPITQDEITMHLIASGVTIMAQRFRERNDLYPYPTSLERGLNRLILAAHRMEQPAPQGINELIEWCRTKPLRQWPLCLPAAAIGETDTLLFGDYTSSICDEWAYDASDVEAEVSEQRIMLAVQQLCITNNDQAGYVAFRRLLIERPVLTAKEFQHACIQPNLTLISQFLRAAYQATPLGWSSNGLFHCCKRCGNMLRLDRQAMLVCETRQCIGFTLKLGKTISIDQNPFCLIRGIQQSVHAPGKTEMSLFQRLKALKLKLELWPAFDRYDLRLSFPSGLVWAIDVKDWSNPFLLARNVKPFAEEPAWNQAFFVFPNERQKRQPDYVRAFLNHAQLDSRTQALTSKSFMQRVKNQLAREEPCG